MKVDLVFSHWERRGMALDRTEEAIELSMGNFHGGSTFSGSIDLEEDDRLDLIDAAKIEADAVFSVVLPKEKT